jgi:hypothetical protein
MPMNMKITRVTENTKFQIDHGWFEKNGQDINVLIAKCLTAEQLEAAGDEPLSIAQDYVNAETGEVNRVTRAMRLIREERAQDPEFIGPRTPVAEAAFRAFLLNNNAPLSAAELAAQIGRTPKEIIDRLGGRIVYNGIKALN